MHARIDVNEILFKWFVILLRSRLYLVIRLSAAKSVPHQPMGAHDNL